MKYIVKINDMYLRSYSPSHLRLCDSKKLAQRFVEKQYIEHLLEPFSKNSEIKTIKIEGVEQ